MGRRFGKRVLIISVFLAVGLLFAAQTFGTAPSPPADSPATASFSAHWVVPGVLAVGALVLLLKPRRRYVTDSEKTDE